MFRVGHGGAAVARPSSMLNSVNFITYAAQLPALAHKQTSRGHLGQVRFALDCVAKLFCSSERARLIQDQVSMRNVHSRIHSPRFDCCVFLFYTFSAVTFATQSA